MLSRTGEYSKVFNFCLEMFPGLEFFLFLYTFTLLVRVKVENTMKF